MPKPTAPGYEMTAAKKVELSETKEYMQKPMVDADYQCADDPLISVNTTIVIPEKICVKVSKNREYVYSEGIESGKEHWRYGVEEGGILLPDGSRFSIINDHVYMATCDAQLIKIGARAGEEVWRQDYYGEFDSQPRLAMQSGVKVIIVTDGSKTYVIDPANGNLALLE
ncbi:MAG: PQQ-binding-like beta-propeller repeat protein [Candidatus Burarchaeum sp.]|nr:PQQ-binding-like beta-propeller repeat protein [Candidatus Burarchaeum sp.]